ncbi:MAG TPA: DUF2690 domain-containing protein [Polyangia bacterium]|jgi:hypothetical protein|nr:DUF2690 domain-containing protein [Polyangia bacterium]
MTQTKTRSRFLLVAAFACALPGLLWARSAAAGTCRGTSCVGLDPVATGCNSDAYAVACYSIVDLNNTQIGRVALRYSPSCNAAWGRVAIFVPHDSEHIEVRNQSFTLLASKDGGSSLSSLLSPMTFGGQTQLASGSIFISGTGYGASTPFAYPPTAAAVSCP